MPQLKPVLLTFHVGPGAGYAIDCLMVTFLRMARQLVADCDDIHIAFPRMNGLESCEAISGFSNIIEFDPATRDPDELAAIQSYIRKFGIDLVFGFDQPVEQPSFRYMRKAGVRKIISYQGAPMSGLNRGVKLFLKRVQVLLSPGSPDLFIFESQAMAQTAYQGRGVPYARTSVVHLGVDENRYCPADGRDNYAFATFSIPRDRRIVYYSGHMEERKGVSVLVRAARDLYERHGRRDFHFLILGNRDGEERRFLKMLDGSGAWKHVTFGGYRKDVDRVLQSCYLGAIASTGWDSFTMSSLEIAACGLPLLVSRLQGLVETIAEGETGYTFSPGAYGELADHIVDFLDNPDLQNRMGDAARQRILSSFTKQQQIENLVDVVTRVASSDR